MWIIRHPKNKKPHVIPIVINLRPKKRKINLAAKFLSTKGQGNTNSCVAFAVVGTIEYMMSQRGILDENDQLSQRFLYHETIKFDKSSEKGIYLTSALHIASTIGICSEEVFPFYQTDKELITEMINENTKPPSEAYIDAKKYKISIYGYLQELNDPLVNKKKKILSIKKALSLDLPVIICYKTSDNFVDSWYSFYTGYLVDPQTGPSRLHCVVIVGYDDDTKTFKFRNSWDTKIFYWGNKGYGYIRYTDVNIITQGWVVAGIRVTDEECTQVQILRSQFDMEAQRSSEEEELTEPYKWEGI